MGRFVGHVDYVRETRTGIGDFILRDVLQARLDAEALQGLLQVAGELTQLLEHAGLAHVHDVIDRREEGGLVLAAQGIGESLYAGAVFQFQYLKARHVLLTSPWRPGSCRASL